MAKDKKELAVAALRNGTVIDRIPAAATFQAVKLLGLDHTTSNVTIGNNLHSNKIGRKGIIKIADTEFPQSVLNRIALIAPTAVVNIIKEYEVVSKQPVTLPDTLVDVVKCDNPKCITNNEPMSTRFIVTNREPVEVRCAYCNHGVAGNKAQILQSDKR